MRPIRAFSTDNSMSKKHSDYKPDTYENPYARVQQALPLEIVIDLSREIPENHIARTVFRAVEEFGAIRFVNCRGRDEHGFKGIDMLKAVILAFAMLGSPSVRDLADLVKSDMAFRLIFPDKTPSFMAFQRFLHDDLKASDEEGFLRSEDILPIVTCIMTLPALIICSGNG